MAIIDNSTIKPLAVNDPLCSSDSIWYKDNEFLSVSDKFDEVEAAMANKANAAHTHTGYASSADLTALTDVVNTKANSSHTHTGYASVNHSHDDYATIVALDTLGEEVGNKADASHTHTEYSPSLHTHNEYAEVSHTHTEYSPVSHTHNNYATATALETLESEINEKASVTHTHIGVYDVNGAAANALISANAYTDSKIDALVGEGASITLDTIGEISSAIEDNQDAIDLLNAAIGNKANVADLNAHANDTEIHITDIERNNWNAKSNFSGNYNDLTNKPNIPSISGLATETYVDTQINAIDIPSSLSDLTTDATHRVVTDAEKAAWNAKSNFSGNYNDLINKPTIPSIAGLATETYVDEVVSAKADAGHNHNNVYYTETEIDTLLSNKSNSNHNHNSSYDVLGTAQTKANEVQANLDEAIDEFNAHAENADIHFTVAEKNKLSGIAANANNYTHPNSGVTAGTYKSVTVNAQGHITGGTNPTTLAGYGITDAESKGAANSALVSAKEYTDDAIADEVVARDSAIATAKSSAISIASSDATTKANNALASAKSYTDTAVATVKNDLLNGAGSAYDTLKELGDLIDDNVDAIEALEAVAAGKANASHTHAISNITNLQSTLDGKAAASHGTHVSYSTTAPVMDGTASVGTATAVARSDHKHPTDTSRAAQTSLDSHTGNKSNPHGVTLAQLGVTANASEINVLDGITATVTELNYVDGVTSNIQTQLNGKAASGHIHTYAGSSSAGGAATSANKLNTDAGSVTQPVYFVNGIPVKTTYTLGASVPSNAKFTDTTYSAVTTSANGLMIASDKVKLDGMTLATVSEVETYLGI